MDSKSSSYVDSDIDNKSYGFKDSGGDDDSFEDSEDDIDDESLLGSDNVSNPPLPNILRPSQDALSSSSFLNTGNCPLIHDSTDSGAQVGSSNDSSANDSDQEDFLQLGASWGPKNTITQTGEVSFPLMSSKSSDSGMANVGSLSGPRVLHVDMVKHTSLLSLMQQPVLVQPVRLSLVGKRIAAGLGFQQSTICISDSQAVLPREGGILHNSSIPSPLDNSENISDDFVSSASLDYSNITEQVLSKSTRVTSEDVSSPFSLVNTDVPPEGDSVPIVDSNLAACGMPSHEDKLFSGSPNKLPCAQFSPSTASNCKALVKPSGDIYPSNSQLNYKGLVYMASNQPY